jgi:hypothetical protein
MYTQQVHISTSDAVIHYRARGCQSPNLQAMHCLEGNFVFDLHNIIQEHNSDVKWDFPALNILS